MSGSPARRTTACRPIDLDVGVARFMRETAGAQVQCALEAIAASSPPTAHEPRKRIKWLRALLRLGGALVDDEDRRRWKRRLRRAARALAEVRQAEVLPATIAGIPDDPATDAPRARLLASAEHERLVATGGARAAFVAAVVRLCQLRVDDLRVADGWGAVARALADTYVAGRVALRDADADGSSVAFHEWRKRVKDLHYHLRLLGVSGKHELAEAADAVAELLGDDHDLAVLSGKLGHGWGGLDATERGIVLRVIGQRMASLRADALARAGDLYRATPSEYLARVAAAADLPDLQAAAIHDADLGYGYAIHRTR